jgi:tRNA pseudouridine55 synthase
MPSALVDGVLLIDKPTGPTSHDVVARIRRTLGQPRIGHAGTLDPLATGLLVLVIGRATRLASLLTAGAKTYEATIRLGVRTSTDDSDGEPIGGEPPTALSDDAIRAALQRFRGSLDQVPPAHSAKKIDGQRAYRLARRAQPVELKPAAVIVHRLDWIDRTGDDVRVEVCASSGFYVRALARDLGVALGCGAHLAALRRTSSGSFTVASAVPLAEAEREGLALARRILPPATALPEVPHVVLTLAGAQRARHGNAVGPEHLVGQTLPAITPGATVKLLGPDGTLIALASQSGGALHPVAVLG